MNPTAQFDPKSVTTLGEYNQRKAADLNQAFEEGFNAYFESFGVPVGCPYETWDNRYTAWHDGFRKAQED